MKLKNISWMPVAAVHHDGHTATHFMPLEEKEVDDTEIRSTAVHERTGKEYEQVTESLATRFLNRYPGVIVDASSAEATPANTPESDPDIAQIKNFLCDICGRTFGARIALVGHMGTHGKS